MNKSNNKIFNEEKLFLSEDKHFIKDFRQFEIAKLGQLALTVVDVRTFMHELLGIVQKSLKTEFVKILKLTEDQSRLKLIEGIGWNQGVVGNTYVEVDYTSQAGYTLINNKPIVVKNFKDETRFTPPPLLTDHHVVSGISITIYGKKKPFGILGAHSQKEIDFTENDVNFLHSVSFILSSVLIQNESITKLREEEEKFRMLMEYASDAIFITTDKGTIIDVNSKACEISGYSKEELLTMSVNNLFSDKTLLKNPIKQAEVLNGKHIIIERGLLRKDRSEILVEISAKLLPNKTIQAIYRDITSRREAELMLRNIQKMEAIGRVTGGMAHDFNNSLSVISGIAEFLLNSEEMNDKLELKNQIERIKNISTKTSILTRELLSKKNYSRLECEINKLLLELSHSLYNVLNKNIELKIKITNEELFVITNPDQLKQSVLNLVFNSRDAISDKGTILVQSNHYTLNNNYHNYAFNAIPGEYVAISVLDNGKGMSDEVKTHLFEPFFTTKADDKGTGLGLASIYGFIKSENGFITISSELEKGTNITIFLPKKI